MKFRRSGGKTPDTGEPRGSLAPTPAPARRRRVAFRRVLALLIVGVVVYAFLFIEQSWMRADGLVQGPAVLVEPVNKARIKDIKAACNDAVKAGQELVTLENETKGIEYDSVVRQLESRKIELSGNVKVAAEDVSLARVGYNGKLAVLAEKATIFNIHDRLYKEGVIARTEWDLARIAYKTAEAESLSAEADWRSKQAVYDRAERQLLSDAKAIDRQLADMRGSEEIQKI
jgi:multidrug resistance efflux pump